jgi:hypothetical protein
MTEEQTEKLIDHLYAEAKQTGIRLPPFMREWFRTQLKPLCGEDELRLWLTKQHGTPAQVASALNVAGYHQEDKP